MTENMKSIVLRHRKVLLSEEMRKKHRLNERDIFSAATLPELDEAYTRFALLNFALPFNLN